MSDSLEMRGGHTQRDALAEVQEAMLRNRDTLGQLDQRARTLLAEMRSLAPPVLPPPRLLGRATPLASPAAPSRQESTRRPATASGPRRERRLGVIAAALLAVALAIWLFAGGPLDLRGSGAATGPAADQRRQAAPAPASLQKGQAVTEALTRSLDSVCVTPPERHPCDGVSLGLWRGDLGAWQALAVQQRLPLPDAEGAFKNAIELRLQMGDPTARIEVARRSGQAAPLLGAAWFHAAGTTRDVEVELRNLGAATAELGGVELVTDQGEVLLRLPPNAALPAGIRCRLSTRPAVSNPCDFSRDTGGRQSTSRPAALILRAKSGETIDRFDTAETARPTR